MPQPQTNIPRIVEVQDPETGHYLVQVRVPLQLAAKFPDKPWGTKIDEVGLASRDAQRFAGYTLVDFEPIQDSTDLHWYFQKLSGPAWTTHALGQDGLVPAKFKRLVTTTRTTQDVAPTTTPTAITGNLASSVVTQQENTGKAVKVDTSEEIDVDGSPLLGKQMIEYGIADTSESLVEEGAALPAIDYYTLSLSQDPLGNGKSVLSTTSIDSFPILEGTEILAPFNIPVQILKQVVPAGTEGSASGNTIIEVRPMDKWRSIQITSVIGFGSLPVPETFPKDVRYKFPDVLESMTFAIVAVSMNDSIQNSAVDVAFDIEEGPSGSFKGYVVRSFHNGPPADADEVWNGNPKGDSLLYAVRHREPFGMTSITRTLTGGKSVPVTLHGALNVRVANNLFGIDLFTILFANFRFASNQSNVLPATAITALPGPNTSILIDRNSERVKGNIWMLEKTYLTMPAP